MPAGLAALLLLTGAAMPETRVSIQLVVAAPDAAATIRLDGQTIFDGTVPPPANADTGPVPLTLGSFPLTTGREHRLDADIAGLGGMFRWIPATNDPAWIVITYYPGRPGEAAPRIGFMRQSAAAKAK